jgi:hypothetical protein
LDDSRHPTLPSASRRSERSLYEIWPAEARRLGHDIRGQDPGVTLPLPMAEAQE